MNNSNYSFNPNYNPNMFSNQSSNNVDDRLIGGGFAFPFLLGGVTGAALAPAFYGGFNRPYYNNYYYYPPIPPYPYPPRPPYRRPY